MPTSAITATGRVSALETMSQGVDILVIGGGVTGAGIALDAATRGLTVGLVEGQDWASGTSSRSSKLVHGGLRYLQQLDFKLVAEALKERELLLRDTAPHLVRPVSFLYPLHKRGIERPYVATGVGLYDTMARLGGKATMPVQKHYTEDGARRLFPDLRKDALIGAVQYWDGFVDDARLVLTLVRTASWLGAQVANRARVEGFLGGDDSAVTGAVVRDLESGQTYEIPATTVIAAAGVWTEKTQDLAGASGGLKVLASKGIHIVVDRDRIKGDVGIISQTEKSVLFIIPWNRYWIIGTTDTAYHEDLDHPVASSADIDYVLEHANEVLESGLTREDVIGTWAGLRPLLQPGTKGEKGETASTKVSREHTVSTPVPGLVTIAGGKLTTYRVMAEDAVDHALGDRAKQLPSKTEHTPLVGGAGYAAYATRVDRVRDLLGCTDQVAAHVLHRYGTLADDIIAMCEADPTLARPVEHAPAYLRAEIAYACTHEQAVHLEDIMCLRTRLTYEVRDHGLPALDEIAEIAAQHLGWDDARREREKDHYRQLCAAEDAAAAAGDDASAAAARAVAPDVSALTSS